MQNFKKLGIKYFFEKDYATARTYFSLAYERRKNKRLLNFILLCDLAQRHPREALLLFSFYVDNYRVEAVDRDFERILHSIELKNSPPPPAEFEEGRALNYADFLSSEEQLGFERSFENIFANGKLIITSKSDFLDFLEKLLEHGYTELTLDYIERVGSHFWDDERFLRLQKKLIGSK